MLDNFKALSLPPSDRITLDDALDIYQAYRPIMPAAVSASPRHAARLVDIIGEFDALVLDGYGVINVGSGPIDGIGELFDAAAKADTPIIVLTNGASFDNDKTWAKYQSWGLPITREQIVSSRDAMLNHVIPNGVQSKDYPAIGSLSATSFPIGVDGERRLERDADFYQETKNFVMLGAVDWSEEDQEALEQAFGKGGRQLHVANPDVVSPHEDSLNAEPGYWTARLIKNVASRLDTGLDASLFPEPLFYGKPYAPAFEHALARLQDLYQRNIDPARIAMVGDSLHTDIIGAGGVGMRSILITDHGLFRDGGAKMAIEKCGIYPDWIVAKV